MVATWVGVALTFDGLKAVAKEPQKVADGVKHMTSFTRGAAAQAPEIGDTDQDAPAHWMFGNDKTGVHAVLIVAADTEEALNDKLADITAADTAHNVHMVLQDDGRTLKGELKGHEHFGFKDGISQPAVKDFHREDANHSGMRENHLGQPLVQPGEFVFGYPSEDEGHQPKPAPKWMKDGSFQVVRRLRQDVAGWDSAVAQEAKKFQPDAIGADRLGACLVGRHKDGTPLAKPVSELRGLGSSQNDFDYANDAKGLDTPLCAHIRRTNPRNFEATQRRRIMRRGIPYGPEFTPETKDTDRGLVFVSYQTSLENQFEFMQETWANNPNFPPGDPEAPNGIDKVIGKNEQGDARIELRDGHKGTVSMKRFIQTTGAVYAFTPSVSTLRKLASNQPLGD
jgi:Dyp-type peroxidase family